MNPKQNKTKERKEMNKALTYKGVIYSAVSFLFIFVFSFLLLPFSSASIYDDCSIYGTCETAQDIISAINYTQVNVNNSIYWNGNAWSDTRWLNIDGSNANQNIGIGSYNLATTGTGFFGWLGSSISRITKGWFADINISDNLIVGGNVSISGYYSGQPIDGSIGSGIIQADEFLGCGCINVTDNGVDEVTYTSHEHRIVHTDGTTTYCYLPSDTVTITDQGFTVYYVDSNCAVQSATFTNYYDFNIHPGDYSRIFDVYKSNGAIEESKGASLIELTNRKSRKLSINCQGGGHLTICDGMNIQENTFPYFNQTSGHYVHINSEVTTTQSNTETDGMHFVYRTAGNWTHDDGTGINLTHCDDGTDLVECSTPQLYRRYYFGSIGWTDTKIHQLASFEDETFTNIGNCLDTTTYPLGNYYTIPSTDEGALIIHSVYCGKGIDSDWSSSWISIGDRVDAGGIPDLSPYMTYTNWNQNADANNYSLTNVDYFQAGNGNFTGNITMSGNLYRGDKFGLVIKGNNVFVATGGVHAGFSTAATTTAVGIGALASISSGNNNVGIGYAALHSLATGKWNTAVGAVALQYTTGSQNTAVGYAAGADNRGTLKNTYLGYFSGVTNRGSNNLFLGAYSGYKQSTTSNLLLIDTIPRADIATELTDSLIVGGFNTVASNQFLRTNSKFSVNADPLTNQVAGDILLGGGSLILKEITTPIADADYGKVYTKTDDKIYFQDGAGIEHEIILGLNGTAFGSNTLDGLSDGDINVSTVYYDVLTAKSPIVQCSDDWCHIVFPKHQKTLWINKNQDWTINEIIYENISYTKQEFWNTVCQTNSKTQYICLKLNNKVTKLENRHNCISNGYEWNGSCYETIKDDVTYKEAIIITPVYNTTQSSYTCTQLNSELIPEETICYNTINTEIIKYDYSFKENCGWDNAYYCNKKIEVLI